MKILDSDQEIWFDEKQAPPSPSVFVLACVLNPFTHKFYWRLWGMLTDEEYKTIYDIDTQVRQTQGFKLTYLVKVYKVKL